MDSFLILAGVAITLIVVALIANGAYRIGYQNGMTAERLRWHEAEMRLERQMIERALSDRDEWETEIDAG